MKSPCQAVRQLLEIYKIPPPRRGRLGGGGKIEIDSKFYLFTLPLVPSHQGRGNRL